MTIIRGALAAVGLAGLFIGQQVLSVPGCDDRAWTGPPGRSVRVATTAQLENSVRRAQPGETILIADGEYRLTQMLDITASRLTLRGLSGDASRVVLRGAGMSERQIGVAISVSASNVTVGDVTLGYVGFHGIQVRGEKGASSFALHNARIVDTGQQLLKGSTDQGGLFADDGLVSCSVFEYTDHAPSDYTNGVDVIAGKGWVVRDSVFRRIRGPESGGWTSGPAILFWGNSQATRIERNTIVDSSRGIAFGLGPGASTLARDREALYDHQGGWIRNNIIVNLNAWADEGIEVSAARDVQIDHNTVITLGRLPWSIGLRFPTTNGQVRNNLTSRPVTLRNGGRASLAGNVSGALPTWFANPSGDDWRLGPGGGSAVDVGVLVPDVTEDKAGQARVVGRLPDAGAFEFRSVQP